MLPGALYGHLRAAHGRVSVHGENTNFFLHYCLCSFHPLEQNLFLCCVRHWLYDLFDLEQWLWSVRNELFCNRFDDVFFKAEMPEAVNVTGIALHMDSVQSLISIQLLSDQTT